MEIIYDRFGYTVTMLTVVRFPRCVCVGCVIMVEGFCFDLIVMKKIHNDVFFCWFTHFAVDYLAMY